MVVLGGAKVADKLAVIDNLLKVGRHPGDRRRHGLHLPRGPGLRGRQASSLDAEKIDTVKGYLPQAEAAGKQILLPVDIVVTPEFGPDARATVVAADAIPADQIGLDIGPKTAAIFAEAIRPRQDGLLERADGRVRNRSVRRRHQRRRHRRSPRCDGLTVVGGGDSAAAVRELGFADDQFGHISTGGGASLEYLEGKKLPGLAVLEQEN